MDLGATLLAGYTATITAHVIAEQKLLGQSQTISGS